MVVFLFIFLLGWNWYIIQHDVPLDKEERTDFTKVTARVSMWINDDNYSYLEGIAKLHMEFGDIENWTHGMNSEFYRFLGYINARVNVRREFEKGNKLFRDGYYI